MLLHALHTDCQAGSTSHTTGLFNDFLPIYLTVWSKADQVQGSLTVAGKIGLRLTRRSIGTIIISPGGGENVSIGVAEGIIRWS
jgi:hypothetical protein